MLSFRHISAKPYLLRCMSPLIAHRVDSLSLSRLDAIRGEADIAPVAERVDPTPMTRNGHGGS
jgi:hypothetical protein